MVQVRFSSVYGSTEQYAQAFAQKLGVEAVELDAPIDSAGAEKNPHKPLVIFTYIHGPIIPGVEFLKKHAEGIGLGDRPIALAVVGMTLSKEARATDPVKELLGDAAKQVHRFYLPGRIKYSTLSVKHRTIMTGLVSALKLKPRKTDNERSMIEMHQKDVDRVDLKELDPLYAWLEEAN